MTKCKAIDKKSYIIHVSAFLGKKTFKQIVKKLGKYIEKLDQKSKTFPKEGPRAFFQPNVIKMHRKANNIKEESDLQKSIECELDKITLEMTESNLGAVNLYNTYYYDCYLYAKDDKYV